ncbi:MAG: S8 family serine peptidase [Candidatus Dormiibacterota bacterium]
MLALGFLWSAVPTTASAATYNPGAPGTDPRDHRPNDPGYASHENKKFPADCPSNASPYDEQFGWFSFAPVGPACNGNLTVSGVSIDKAWQLSLGRPDVTVAVIDTGVRWEDRDIRRQVRLNWAELPPPEHPDTSSSCANVDLSTYAVRGPAPPCYLNGQSYFNVDSYVGDPRVVDFKEPDWTEDAANPANDSDGNLINAADLIHTFSSWCTSGGTWHGDPSGCAAVDNDGNGYAHDIAGWNFMDDNNDPHDLSSYSSANNHGTGRMKDAVAEANNGVGGVGSCPQCTFLPIRTHSFFIMDENAYGAAAVYAADMGASVMELAFAAVNNTPFARAATRYAVDHGVVPVSITQDLNTADHLYPENYPDVLTVNGIVPDSQGLGMNGQAIEPQTYFRSSNLTAPGDHLDVGMEGATTGSVASAQTSGIVALLVAHSRELADAPYHFLDRPITPLEAEQLLKLTADGVTTAEVLPTPLSVFPDPPAPGGSPPRATSAQLDGSWSQYFGYGRINAGRALEWLGQPANFVTPSGTSGPALPVKIPPEVSLTSPDWWQQVDPTVTPSLPLTGYLGHLRCPGPATFKVEAAPGIEPTTTPINQFTTLLTRSMNGSTETGTLANIATSSLPVPQASGAPANREAFSVTLRLSVNDSCGRHGETRRVIHVHHDPTVHGGFPINFGSGIVAGVHLTDLLGDGNMESIVANDAGELHVLDAAGHDVPWFNSGHPFLSQRSSATLHTSAPGLAHGGLPLPHTSFTATPAVGDLLGDGRQEIVAVDLDGHVYALDATGAMLPGFPVMPDPSLVPVSNENKHNHQQRGVSASPALGRLDDAHPGQLDIVVGALDQRVYVWRPDGVFLPSFNSGHPKLLADTSQNPTSFAQITSTPAVGNLLGDGHQQIVVPTTEFYAAKTADFNTLLNTMTGNTTSIPANLIANAVQGLGVGNSNRTYALDRGGHILSGWPVATVGLAPDALAPVGPVPALLGDFGSGPRAVLSLFTGPVNIVKANGVIDEGLAPNHGAASGVSPASGTVSLNALGHGALGDLGSGLGLGIFEGGITANALVDDVLVGQNFPFDHDLSAWNPLTGQMYPAFPQPMEDYQAFVEPAVAPVGGTLGSASVISGSGLYLVHAYDIAGQDAPNFPKFTGGWANQAPALADLDRNGKLNLVVGTHEGYLFSWNVPGDACANNQWWSNHHDEWNSGAYGNITRPPGAINDLRLRNVVHGANGGFTAEWTASGAEFRCGNAVSASVRVSANPITPQNFDQATEVAQPSPGVPGQDPVINVSGQNLGTCVYVALQVRNSAGLRSPLAEVKDGAANCASIPSGSGITPQQPTTASTTTPVVAEGLPNSGATAGGGVWIGLGLALAYIVTRRRRRLVRRA